MIEKEICRHTQKKDREKSNEIGKDKIILVLILNYIRSY